MEGISKTYSNGVRALIDTTFSAKSSEIHGLLGENGAGKTTLMNILYGSVTKDAGTVSVDGKEVEVHSPHDALKLGIGMVHQHFKLIPAFTAAENVALVEASASEVTKKLDLTEVRKKMDELGRSSGLPVDPDALVEDLNVGMQQRVDILKLLYKGAKILLLDEPTSVLTPLEINPFFETLRKFRAEGKTVVFITHKLDEIMAVCDRVTVLRRGRLVGTAETSVVTTKDLARMMVGAGYESLMAEAKVTAATGERKPILQVKGLEFVDARGVKKLDEVTFDVREGEVLGIAGVEGNGQAELVSVITGMEKPKAGEVSLDGKRMESKRTSVIKSDVAYIPDDRLKWGLCAPFTVSENLILGVDLPGELRSGMYLKQGPIKRFSRDLMSKFKVVAPNESVPVGSLSGGNQQKVVTAREISKDPRLIVAHEPTHGLDISATKYIHDLLLALRSGGKAVLLVSSDLDEILALSDRVAVMSRGKIVGIKGKDEHTLESLGLMMGGIKAE
jgi:general nucleoside transport system ATP-binding protein